MNWQIGKTVTVKGKLEMCKKGIHLTLAPKEWRGERVFIAQTSEVYAFQEEGMKIVCRNAKLLWELSPPLLKTYEDGCAQLLKTYKDGCAQLLKTYKDGCAPLWKTYKKNAQKLIANILKKGECHGS